MLPLWFFPFALSLKVRPFIPPRAPVEGGKHLEHPRRYAYHAYPNSAFYFRKRSLRRPAATCKLLIELCGLSNQLSLVSPQIARS